MNPNHDTRFHCCECFHKTKTMSKLTFKYNTICCDSEGCDHSPFWCHKCTNRMPKPEEAQKEAEVYLRYNRHPGSPVPICDYCENNQLPGCNGETRRLCNACAAAGRTRCEKSLMPPQPPKVEQEEQAYTPSKPPTVLAKNSRLEAAGSMVPTGDQGAMYGAVGDGRPSQKRTADDRSSPDAQDPESAQPESKRVQK